MKGERGFTLLEVLVAAAVMAFAIAGVLSALSTSMRNASRLTDYDRAAMLAKHKLDELLVDKRLPKFVMLEGQWDPSQTNGRTSGWRARVTPWEMPPGVAPGMPIVERIELEVWWMEGDQRKVYPIEGFRKGMLTPADVAAGALLSR